MHQTTRVMKCIAASLLKGCLLFYIILAPFPGVSQGAIIWSGDFETGDFMQYVHPTDPAKPFYWGFPEYCWPIQPRINATSDGSCGGVVTLPVRQGKYAAKITVKNSINGKEPEDCDGSKCDRRRSETNFYGQMESLLNGMPYQSERWISISHYIPADWDSTAGLGSYINVLQIKSLPSTLSPTIALIILDGKWGIIHRWSEKLNPQGSDYDNRKNITFTSTYPNAAGTDSGAGYRADFPNQAASQAALADLNKGGWTDWVIHVRFDHRGSLEGGTGFLNVYKRKAGGSWVQILAMVPRVVSKDGITYDRGICYGTTKGYGTMAGMYGGKEQFWTRPANRVLYHDNFKVGDKNETLQSMSPEGGTGASVVSPSPPPAFRKLQ